MVSPNSYEEHFRSEAAELRVSVLIEPGLRMHNLGVMLLPRTDYHPIKHQVRLPRFPDNLTLYTCAMHELGHAATLTVVDIRAANLMQPLGPSAWNHDVVIKLEAKAWRWARQHALELDRDVCREAMKTYVESWEDYRLYRSYPGFPAIIRSLSSIY